MGRKYNSAAEAVAAGTRCNFQLPVTLALPTLTVPSLPIAVPSLPDIPTVPYYCPLDEEPEPTLGD